MTPCVEWTGRRDKDGYGIEFKHGTTKAHRVAWIEKNGPIPDGMNVLHQCDNPPCVRISHLFLGTNADNQADKVAKGRQAKRESHGRARLTLRDVQAVRAAYSAGATQKGLASQYGVAYQTIGRVVRSETWT